MESPEITASFSSRWTLWWLNKFISLGSKKPIEKEDLYTLIPDRKAETLIPKLEKYWREELKTNNPSIINALWKCHRVKLTAIVAVQMTAAVVNMLSLSAIGLLIDWFVDNEIIGIYNDKRDGFILVAIVMAFLTVTIQVR